MLKELMAVPGPYPSPGITLANNSVTQQFYLRALEFFY